MGRQVRKAAPLGVVLDAAAAAPLHRQIGAQLRRAILERRLPPGAPLPSSRLIASELHCARGTVSVAIDQLIAEGYIVSRAASGISVAPDLPDEMLAVPGVDLPRTAPELLPTLPSRTRVLLADQPGPVSAASDLPTAFPIGQPDREAFPFPLWAKLLERTWRAPSWSIAGTPHAFGHPELRQAIARYLGAARGFACDPAAVVITSGVRQSVALLARVVLEAGDAACVEEPGYPGMAEALAAAGVRSVPVPMDAAGFPPEAAMMLAPDARLIVVAPSHQFPLGTVMTLPRRLELLRWAERTQGWIVEDDFDGEYRYAGRPLAPLRALDRTGRVAYLGSFSKILFPALRLSFLVLPAGLVTATERVMVEMGPGASLLGQAALARFIEDGHFAIHLRRTRLLYAARQQALIEAARRHLVDWLLVAPDPSGMHLVAAPHPGRDFDDVAITAAVMARDVRVSPLSACYRGVRRGSGLILGYAATPEPDIEVAVVRLQEVLRRA